IDRIGRYLDFDCVIFIHIASYYISEAHVIHGKSEREIEKRFRSKRKPRNRRKRSKLSGVVCHRHITLHRKKVECVEKGFGDALNCEENWKSVERYVDEQFNQYFQDESGLNRKNIQDHRVHCCIYFIPPFGHGLRQLDVEFLKRLQNKVNIVPVIAKADTLTPAEIYQFPECDEDEDEDFKLQDQALKASIPFAVIGSNCVIEVAGKKVRGRQYPWGIVEVENAAHCDFVKLRTMLISTHMQDLKEVTQDVHYETFRARCISQMHVALKERNKLKRDSMTNLDQIGDADRLLQQKDEEI
ncbi:Cytosolic non-specific dipeptidase, partial [Armadillidium vulgare]